MYRCSIACVAAIATQDGNKDISKDHPGTSLGMAVSVTNKQDSVRGRGLLLCLHAQGKEPPIQKTSTRVVLNSRQPAELTGYLGRLCRLLL